MFESVPVERVVASPARRCRQTAEPLARRHEVPVEVLAGLLPGGHLEYVRGLIAGLGGGGSAGAAIVCTHGETMRPLLAAVRRAGGKIVTMRDDDGWLLRKGTGWELTLNGNHTIVALRHLVPRSMRTCTAHDPLVS
jgi:phosphohistidine phosphatase SixA